MPETHSAAAALTAHGACRCKEVQAARNVNVGPGRPCKARVGTGAASASGAGASAGVGIVSTGAGISACSTGATSGGGDASPSAGTAPVASGAVGVASTGSAGAGAAAAAGGGPPVSPKKESNVTVGGEGDGVGGAGMVAILPGAGARPRVAWNCASVRKVPASPACCSTRLQGGLGG